jgi:hypothetical protein
MLGYVQSDSLKYWFDEIAARMGDGAQLDAVPRLEAIETKDGFYRCRSRHASSTQLGEITIYHIFLLFSNNKQ